VENNRDRANEIQAWKIFVMGMGYFMVEKKLNSDA
jgi:hypothetical protein